MCNGVAMPLGQGPSKPWTRSGHRGACVGKFRGRRRFAKNDPRWWNSWNFPNCSIGGSRVDKDQGPLSKVLVRPGHGPAECEQRVQRVAMPLGQGPSKPWTRSGQRGACVGKFLVLATCVKGDHDQQRLDIVRAMWCICRQHVAKFGQGPTTIVNV